MFSCAAASVLGSFIMARLSPVPTPIQAACGALFTGWLPRRKANILSGMFAPHVLPDAREYDALYRPYQWSIPALNNIGVDVCASWAAREPRRTALLNVRSDGSIDEISYGALRETSNRLANVLAAHGLGRGDRVAILLQQQHAVDARHIAIYKLGAIALPLAMLFGLEAISYRLQGFCAPG